MPISKRNSTRGSAITNEQETEENGNKKNGKYINGKKRLAESPEKMQCNVKRPVFGNITNANQENAEELRGKAEEKRVTRSNTSSLKPMIPSTQELRKSKRLNEKKTVNNEEKPECSSDNENNESGSSLDSLSSSKSSSYETARESVELKATNSKQSVTVKQEVRDIQFTVTVTDLIPAAPEGIINFDKESALDPFSFSLYANDIFQYFKTREVKFLPEKYIKKQPEISKGMRSILVDWMVEVQENFELNHETLYLSVKLVDLYLSRELITKNTLQLLGSAALLVAAKFDERSPPAIEDFLYICDDAYDRRQLLRMEIKLLKTVNFDLGIPLSYSFLRRYARCSKQTMELLTLARYILELSLLEYDMVDVPDSLIAAASLSLALQMKKLAPWNPTLEYSSGYRLPELTDLIHRLNEMRLAVEEKNLHTISNKYSHTVFFEVAKIPPLEELST